MLYCLANGDRDKSMENMLSIEDDRYSFMKPLNQFRNYIMSRHFDMNSHNWSARNIDTDTGTISVSPNTLVQILSEEVILGIDCYGIGMDIINHYRPVKLIMKYS